MSKNWQQRTAAAHQVANHQNPQQRAVDHEAVAATAHSQQSPAELPTPATWLKVTGDRIDLVNPEIHLMGHTFINGDQVRFIKVSSAYIVGGILVAEELGMWFPLATIQLGKKISP